MMERPLFNAQVTQLQDRILHGEPIGTRRGHVLGQLMCCEGCCCGRVDKGFPALPKEMLKERWKALQLNKTIQLTISGCLGPCDLANVVCIHEANGSITWLGGLFVDADYELLIEWAGQCQAASCLIPLPAVLNARRFSRFEFPGTARPSCEQIETPQIG